MFLETKQNMKRSLTSALESASQAKADMARAALLCTLVLLKNNVLNVRDINITIAYMYTTIQCVIQFVLDKIHSQTPAH